MRPAFVRGGGAWRGGLVRPRGSRYVKEYPGACDRAWVVNPALGRGRSSAGSARGPWRGRRRLAARGFCSLWVRGRAFGIGRPGSCQPLAQALGPRARPAWLRPPRACLARAALGQGPWERAWGEGLWGLGESSWRHWPRAWDFLPQPSLAQPGGPGPQLAASLPPGTPHLSQLASAQDPWAQLPQPQEPWASWPRPLAQRGLGKASEKALGGTWKRPWERAPGIAPALGQGSLPGEPSRAAFQGSLPGELSRDSPGRLPLEGPPWKVPLEGFPGRLPWKAPLEGSPGRFCCKAPLEGSPGRFPLEGSPWKVPLEGSLPESLPGEPSRVSLPEGPSRRAFQGSLPGEPSSGAFQGSLPGEPEIERLGFKLGAICGCGDYLGSYRPEVFRLEKRFPKWKKYSTDMRSSLAMSSRAKPWSAGNPMRGVPTHVGRIVDVLDVAVQTQHQRGLVGAAARANFWADYSQGVESRPWGGLRTLCQGNRNCKRPCPHRLFLKF